MWSGSSPHPLPTTLTHTHTHRPFFRHGEGKKAPSKGGLDCDPGLSLAANGHGLRFSHFFSINPATFGLSVDWVLVWWLLKITSRVTKGFHSGAPQSGFLQWLHWNSFRFYFLENTSIHLRLHVFCLPLCSVCFLFVICFVPVCTSPPVFKKQQLVSNLTKASWQNSCYYIRKEHKCSCECVLLTPCSYKLETRGIAWDMKCWLNMYLASRYSRCGLLTFAYIKSFHKLLTLNKECPQIKVLSWENNIKFQKAHKVHSWVIFKSKLQREQFFCRLPAAGSRARCQAPTRVSRQQIRVRIKEWSFH